MLRRVNSLEAWCMGKFCSEEPPFQQMVLFVPWKNFHETEAEKCSSQWNLWGIMMLTHKHNRNFIAHCKVLQWRVLLSIRSKLSLDYSASSFLLLPLSLPPSLPSSFFLSFFLVWMEKEKTIKRTERAETQAETLDQSHAQSVTVSWSFQHDSPVYKEVEQEERERSMGPCLFCIQKLKQVCLTVIKQKWEVMMPETIRVRKCTSQWWVDAYCLNGLSVLCAQTLGLVQLFVAPRAVAHQAPMSVEFPRQEYWSGMPVGGSYSRGSSQPRDQTHDWQVDSLPLPPGKP